MEIKTDIEIAQSCVMEPITAIAKRAHVDEKYIEQYGKYKAKIDPALLRDTDREDGRQLSLPRQLERARPPRPSVWRTACAA